MFFKIVYKPKLLVVIINQIEVHVRRDRDERSRQGCDQDKTNTKISLKGILGQDKHQDRANGLGPTSKLG